MNITGLDDSRDDSSVNTEHSTANQRNSSFISELPSMQSPASNASTHDDASHEINPKPVDDYEIGDIELEKPFKVFLPQRIPSVGEVDPMIKIPRSDGVVDGVGGAILDEHIDAIQSNAAFAEPHLRNVTKNISRRAVAVRDIINTVKNTNEIDQWIQSVEETHSKKQQPTQNKMDYMKYQIKREIADEIKKGLLYIPSADIDLSVEEYARMLCSLFEIPVHEEGQRGGGVYGEEWSGPGDEEGEKREQPERLFDYH
ncbi:hypothetical protein ACHAXA_010127 [Cyclostephanos tholiformis]|uniref:Uncharacterized protein n=1 Tax=Cyclostephanos tholiformis TaxID=382380 RepID=A0ABD3RXR1_9STRA